MAAQVTKQASVKFTMPDEEAEPQPAAEDAGLEADESTENEQEGDQAGGGGGGDGDSTGGDRSRPRRSKSSNEAAMARKASDSPAKKMTRAKSVDSGILSLDQHSLMGGFGFQPARDNPQPQMAPGVTDGTNNPVPLDVCAAQWMAGDQVVLVMVGLPARGKTHVARRVARYLDFFHSVPVRVFNVGEYRRKLYGHQPASFFDPSDQTNVAARHKCTEAAMEDMREFLTTRSSGQVAIFDATNTTMSRRQWVRDQLADLKTKLIFIEVICEDEDLIDENIRAVKLNLPDYAGMDPEACVQDFRNRIRNYEKVYETIDENLEKRSSWIKILDCQRFTINNIRGYLPSKIVQFVMSLHTSPHTVYISRHGQSMYNLRGKIGGDSSLSADGDLYARKLAEFVTNHVTKDAEDNVVPARLWTSRMTRTIDTAKYIEHPVIEVSWSNDDLNGQAQTWRQMRHKTWANLDELFAGVCDGMTYEEIEREMPEEFNRRQADKLGYRYPRGESYLDVIHRLDPVIHDMERIRETLLVIGHQGILRVIYAYYLGLSREEAPYVSIPLNTVIKLTPQTYGCQEERILLVEKKAANAPDGQNEPPVHQPEAADQESPEIRQLASFDINEPPSC